MTEILSSPLDRKKQKWSAGFGLRAKKFEMITAHGIFWLANEPHHPGEEGQEIQDESNANPAWMIDR